MRLAAASGASQYDRCEAGSTQRLLEDSVIRGDHEAK
jgi:hypothetical protein